MAMTANSNALTTAARLRNKRRQASAQRLRPLMASSGCGCRGIGLSGKVAVVMV
jgi:hypothetical protein